MSDYYFANENAVGIPDEDIVMFSGNDNPTDNDNGKVSYMVNPDDNNIYVSANVNDTAPTKDDVDFFSSMNIGKLGTSRKLGTLTIILIVIDAVILLAIIGLLLYYFGVFK